MDRHSISNNNETQSTTRIRSENQKQLQIIVLKLDKYQMWNLLFTDFVDQGDQCVMTYVGETKKPRLTPRNAGVF